MFHDVGVKVTLLEYLPRIVPLEDAEVSKLARAQLHQARHDGHDQRPVRCRVGHDRRQRHLPDGRPGGQGAGGASRRDDARRDRPRRQHRGHRARDDQGRDRPRRHQGQRPDADEGAARLRDRRRHRRAVAGPHRRARGDHRRPHDRRRRRRPRDGLHGPAAGDLLPARDRVDRPDRGAVRPSAASRSRSARSRSRRSPRRSSAASTRASPRSSPTPRPTTRSASTSSGRTRPTSSPRRRSASSSRRRRGRSAARPTPTRRCPRSSARRRWPSTGGRSTSRCSHAGPKPGITEEARPAAMAVTKGSDSKLGAAVGLSDADLVEMYRLRRARPGRRRADVDPQPGRPDPVRHQRPGPRGRPGRDRLGVREGPGLDRAVLPLDRDVPDLRDEPARHHDRPVRDGLRPVVGRPPDARPLRQPRAQPRVGLVAGRDPAAPRRRDRAGGQDPQDRPGRDDEHGRGLVEPGRRPRGAQLRGDPQAAVHLRRREQRLCDQRAGGHAGVGRGRRRSGGRLRDPGRRRRRRGRARLLRRRARRGRPGSSRRGADADRGQGDPADRALVGRPADEVPLRRGARRPRRPTTRCRGSASSCATPAS